MPPDDFVVSESGVLGWKSPERHPLLRNTNTKHPAFIRKAAETFTQGRVQGLPKIGSENSEDACTWFYFSPLLKDPERKTLVLSRLLREAFPGQVSDQLFQALPSAKLHFWHGRKTPCLVFNAPPTRKIPEGPSEPDLVVTTDSLGVVFIEAKYKAKMSECTKHDKARDEVIRYIDVGSWFARERFQRFYFVTLQYGDHQTNVENVVARYARNPHTVREKLPYRDDLSDADVEVLSKSVGFVRWPDPISWQAMLCPLLV